jgi:hypothetical protein
MITVLGQGMQAAQPQRLFLAQHTTLFTPPKMMQFAAN